MVDTDFGNDVARMPSPTVLLPIFTSLIFGHHVTLYIHRQVPNLLQPVGTKKLLKTMFLSPKNRGTTKIQRALGIPCDFGCPLLLSTSPAI